MKLSGLVARMKRGKDTAEGVQACRIVAQRRPEDLRLRGVEIEVEDAGNCDSNSVIGCAIDVGTIGAEASDGAMDKARIGSCQGAGIDAATLSDADANGQKVWRLRVGPLAAPAATDLAARIGTRVRPTP